jgi:hypothetical protein
LHRFFFYIQKDIACHLIPGRMTTVRWRLNPDVDSLDFSAKVAA